MDLERVKLIFKESYGLYKLFQNEELFKAITDNIMKTSEELVPGIMADTYNFYVKWDNASDQEIFPWDQMRNESIELTHRYNECELCRAILLNLCNIIEQEFKHRE